jgi:hypothetical protein
VQRLLQSLAAVRAGLAETLAMVVARLPQFDYECPLMSLPAVFGTTIETVPWPGAYLGAEPELIAEKRARFTGVSGVRRLRVGLAWAGNPRYKADRLRSVQLPTLLPLLRNSSIAWVSLQKGSAAEQIAALPEDVELADGSSRDHDLAETAALISQLDMVMTTDTSIAHLAGAMGKPTWILLPHLGDWRWMQRIETTPWYPTARLFRQSSPGDWDGLVQRVAGELKKVPRLERRRLPRPAIHEPESSWLIPA